MQVIRNPEPENWPHSSSVCRHSHQSGDETERTVITSSTKGCQKSKTWNCWSELDVLTTPNAQHSSFSHQYHCQPLFSVHDNRINSTAEAAIFDLLVKGTQCELSELVLGSDTMNASTREPSWHIANIGCATAWIIHFHYPMRSHTYIPLVGEHSTVLPWENGVLLLLG